MRNTGLDILRFIAVFLVILRHAPEGRGHPANPLGHAFYLGGWVGVDVFFVLSGFLVSGLLFKEYERSGRIDGWRFLIRRGFKIYPGLWVLLLLTVPVPILQGVGVDPRRVIGELLFLQNYYYHFWGVNWSLAVEEHFYLLLVALFAFLTSRARLGALPSIFGATAVSCLALRLFHSAAFTPGQLPAHYSYTHTRIDSLMFGVLLAYLWHMKGVRFERLPSWALAVASALLLLPSFLFPIEDVWWITVYGLTLNYLGAGCLLLAAVRIEHTKALLLRLIASLGAYSYSIYLWHWPLHEWGMHALQKRVPLSDALYYPVYIIGCIVMGALMGWLIEMPMLRLRDRLYPAANSSQLSRRRTQDK